MANPEERSKIREAFQALIPAEKTGNTISNRDIEFIRNMLRSGRVRPATRRARGRSVDSANTISNRDIEFIRNMLPATRADRERTEQLGIYSPMARSDGGTAESTMSDDEKRNFIVDVQKIGANTAAELSGDPLEKAYRKARHDAEMVDELGYTRGVKPDRKKRGAVKYSKGGAVKGKKFAGSF
jgi:hypothetical protein